MSSQGPEVWELGTECRAEASAHESVVPKFGSANGEGGVGGERGVFHTLGLFKLKCSKSQPHSFKQREGNGCGGLCPIPGPLKELNVCAALTAG